MKLVNLRKIHQGHYLTYYIADYQTKNNHIKSYEFVSRHHDLTIETFGTHKPVGASIVAFSKDGNQILLEKEFRLATNNWVFNFPAGLIDKGESPENAAKRELKEETGLDLTEIKQVLSSSYTSQVMSDEIMITVIGTAEGTIKNSDFEDEEIKARWYTKKEVKKLIEEGTLMSARTQLFLYGWTNLK